MFAKETGHTDLTPRQYAILAAVAATPDVSQTGLVEQTGVDRSTLADIVRRLVERKLLQRKRTKEDARMYAVRITAKGRAALSAMRPAASRVDTRILSVLKARERARFIASLAEIVEAMSRSAADAGEG
ncbi:MAG: MarR family transcriptional regulator [Hyphomicrobiaceae bacterium]|nr:MarR family transcriptional regulator [Hyphomicrobiaceae bacterium]